MYVNINGIDFNTKSIVSISEIKRCTEERNIGTCYLYYVTITLINGEINMYSPYFRMFAVSHIKGAYEYYNSNDNVLTKTLTSKEELEKYLLTTSHYKIIVARRKTLINMWREFVEHNPKII